MSRSQACSTGPHFPWTISTSQQRRRFRQRRAQVCLDDVGKFRRPNEMRKHLKPTTTAAWSAGSFRGCPARPRPKSRINEALTARPPALTSRESASSSRGCC